NATEAINLVAQSWGRHFLKAGDEVILSEMEHHANIVPWHILQSQIGITIKYIPITPDGSLNLDVFSAMLNDNTKFISLTHVSNVLGTRNDVAHVMALARAHNADIKILIDGSQGIVHGGVDISVLNPDFYVWTGHKLYGPTGVGVLYGRPELLELMPPYQGGGDMIETVSFAGSLYAKAPAKFEAGTPAIAEVIGLGAAIDYMTAISMDNIMAWEDKMSMYAHAALADICGLQMFGTTPDKVGILSFTLDGCPPADVAMI
ncbi:MAG: aminotransferase class V-fold PLP-dependent enzyme, partial [Pseudomonadota bacterium]